MARLKGGSVKPVIEIRHLKKGFEDQMVLKDISLQLYEGENLVVMGKSGCGKSVLVKCIIGLMVPDAGTINVLGSNVTGRENGAIDEIREKIGFLFQGGALYDSMTVVENLELHLTRIKKDLSESEIRKKIHEALENVGLPDSHDKMPSELSGGMRKRISLARTIVVEPLIMLYDEPTTGLDPATTEEISMLINEIKIKYKTSSLIITHDITCARTTADRIIMMENGVVYSEGDFSSFENSEDPIIKSFFK